MPLRTCENPGGAPAAACQVNAARMRGLRLPSRFSCRSRSHFAMLTQTSERNSAPVVSSECA